MARGSTSSTTRWPFQLPRRRLEAVPAGSNDRSVGVLLGLVAATRGPRRNHPDVDPHRSRLDRAAGAVPSAPAHVPRHDRCRGPSLGSGVTAPPLVVLARPRVATASVVVGLASEG